MSSNYSFSVTHWDIIMCLVTNAKEKMPLIMKHIVWLNLARQWRCLTDKSGFLFYWDTLIHSKTPGSNLTMQERVNWGQTPFRIKSMNRKSVNLMAEYDPEMGQSDPFICQVCRKLTKFWVTFDPELSMTPIQCTLFRVTLTRVFLECRLNLHNII